MEKRFCPKCESENVAWRNPQAGPEFGAWICNDCGFSSREFPIKEKIENVPKEGEKYKHFKGWEYEIVAVARDCEEPEKLHVIYKSLVPHGGFPEGTIWRRDLEDFNGEKKFKEDAEYNGKEYKKGDKVKRFVKIE